MKSNNANQNGDIFMKDLIREFKDHVNWDCLSKYQKISEEVMIDLKYKAGSPTDNPTISGSYCKRCNLYNEYIDKKDYICYSCSH